MLFSVGHAIDGLFDKSSSLDFFFILPPKDDSRDVLYMP
jgi:hypothetical protein